MAACPNGAVAIITSPDGITWTTRLTSLTANFYDVIWSETHQLFVAVGNTGAGHTSPDGVTWTAMATQPAEVVAVAEKDGVFVAVSLIGDSIYRSTDGVLWTSLATAVPLATGWLAIGASGSHFAICGTAASGNRNFATSPDGITWTAWTSGTTDSWNGMAWSNELDVFMATSEGAVASKYSVGPAAWTAGSVGGLGTALTYHATSWHGSFFLTGRALAGHLDRRDTPTSAVVDIDTGSGQIMFSTATNGSILVAVGNGGAIRTSPLTIDTRVPPPGIFPFNLGPRDGVGATVGERGGSFTTGTPSSTVESGIVMSGVSDDLHTHQAIPPYGTFQAFIKAKSDAPIEGIFPVFDAVAFATQGMISQK